MDYTVFDAAQQAEMLRRHLLQHEADHFAHTLNAEKCEAAERDEKDAGRKKELGERAAEERKRAATAERDAALVKARIDKARGPQG